MAFRRRLGLAPPVISAHTSARQRGARGYEALCAALSTGLCKSQRAEKKSEFVFSFARSYAILNETALCIFINRLFSVGRQRYVIQKAGGVGRLDGGV